MEIDNLKYERALYEEGITLIAGTDEVGRGPIVGPVVAAAVILPKNYQLDGLTDSKKISEKKRKIYYDIILRDAISVGIGVVSEKIIDEINILEASRLAMMKAIENLSVKPEHILSDAMKLDVGIPVTPIIKGDLLSISISAASVVAKVTRDEMMIELDKTYPMYEFSHHKGYPTKRHLELIHKYGILDNYRMSFKPVKEVLESGINEK